MMNKVFSITTTAMNVSGVVDTLTYLKIAEKTPIGGSEYNAYFPKQIHFVNNYNTDATVNIFDPNDYAKYEADVTNFDFFTVKAGTTFQMGTEQGLPNAYKIIVKATNPSSGVFNIECLNYQPIFGTVNFL